MATKTQLERIRQRLREKDRTAAEEMEALRREREDRSRRTQQLEHAKVVKALEKELADMEVRQAFLDVLEEAPEPKPLKIKVLPKQGRKLPAGTYFMLLSDVHVGERVRPDAVGGRNEYTPEIAQERVRQFFDSQLTMLRAAQSAWDVRQTVLWLGGDIMTGFIHEEYAESNFMSPTEEVLLAHEILASGINFLLEKSDLEKILIPCNYGNHGRTTKKIRVSTGAKNSFEWLLYQFLSRRYASEPRVEFQVANGYHALVDCYGFKVLFSHGDALRYQGGIGGISVPANRRIAVQAQSVPVHWEGSEQGAPNLHVWAHWHYLHYPWTYVQNGSVIGWNEFAERGGFAYQAPLQSSFVVDAKHRMVSNFNPIIVDRRLSAG